MPILIISSYCVNDEDDDDDADDGGDDARDVRK